MKTETYTRHTKANANFRVCASRNAVGYAFATKKLTEWCELSSKPSTMSGYVHYAHIRAQHGIHICICASRWLPHTSNVMNTYQPASHPQPSAAKHCDCIEMDRCPRTVPTEHVYCIYEKYRLMYMNIGGFELKTCGVSGTLYTYIHKIQQLWRRCSCWWWRRRQRRKHRRRRELALFLPCCAYVFYPSQCHPPRAPRRINTVLYST